MSTLRRLTGLVQTMMEESPDDVVYHEVLLPENLIHDPELTDVHILVVDGWEIPISREVRGNDRLVYLYERSNGSKANRHRALSEHWALQDDEEAQVYHLTRQAGGRTWQADRAVQALEELTPPEREVYLALLADRTPWERAAELAQAVSAT